MGILLKEMILETSKDKEIQDVIHVLQHNTRNYFKGHPSSKNDLLLHDNQIVVPKSLRSRTKLPAHYGHLGINKTKSLMRSKVWWPGLDSDVTYMGANLYGKRLHSMPKKYMEIWGGGEHLKSLKISNVPIILFKYTSY